jgi:hypothetical protein
MNVAVAMLSTTFRSSVFLATASPRVRTVRSRIRKRFAYSHAAGSDSSLAISSGPILEGSPNSTPIVGNVLMSCPRKHAPYGDIVN